MIISNVSAFEFDNVKSYSKINKEITIKNAFGLGKDISKITLNTPLIYNVMRGKDRLVAEFTIDNFKDYKNVFNNMEFYDVKNSMNNFDREFIYKYKTFYDIEVLDYETICKERLNNGTIEKYDCYENFTGSHFEERFNWNIFDDKKDLPKGKITLGIFTDVLPNEEVEWIPTLFGVEINEWATWTESLNVGLVVYYKLDESSGDVVDSTGNQNGTNSGATRNIEGKIGKAFDFESSESDYVDLGDGVLDFTGNMTVSVWVKIESFGSPDYIFARDCGTVQNCCQYKFETYPNNVYFSRANTGGTFDGAECIGCITTNQWYHFVGIFNDTNSILWINGSLVDISSGFTGTQATTATNTFLGRRGNGYYFDGLIDEVAVWNRTLTDSEISDLWNSGDGITYSAGEEDTTKPNVTINTPLNQTYSTNSITFNITSVDETLMDACWYSLDNGATNYSMTNVSSFYSNTNSSMTQGSHTVNFYCNDSSNNLNDSESITFFIDSINPLIEIAYPLNDTYDTNISTLNYTYVEANCNYTWYSINGGAVNSTLETCGTNFTGIVSSESLNTWIVFINDTAGNINQSSVSFTISIPPIITVQSPLNTSYTNPTIWFNATSSEIISSWIVNYNGTNATININNSLEVENGYFNMKLWANDSYDNWGLNDTIYFTMAVDNTPPYFITIPDNASLIYSEDWNGVFFNASDETIFDSYSVNDTSFTINSTGYLLNSSDLAYGNYLLNISINDTANNMNYTLYHIQINQSTDNCQILFNESSPLVYPNIFLVMTDCNSPYSMKVNGSSISNNSVFDSGAGAYNFSVFRTDNVNYSNIYDEEEFQITKSLDSCQVYFNESSPLIYPDIFTTYTNCSSAYTLAINGSTISNNTIQILASGAYNFSVIRTDESNYTNLYDDEEFQISLGSTLGSLSGTSPLTYTAVGDIEGSESNSGDSDINYYLYRNGTLVNNPDATILAYGYYTYIYNNSLGENYSASASLDTYSLLINQNTSSCQIYFNNTSPLVQPSIFTTWTNCTSSYVLEINGSAISNNSINVLPVGSYNYSILRDDDFNYSNIYDDEYFVLNIGTGDGNLSLNSSVVNKIIYRTEVLLINGTLDVGIGNIYIFINDTLFNSGTSPLSSMETFNTINYYEINLTYLGNINYTSFSKFLYVNVIANPFADISIKYPSSLTYASHITELNYTVVNYTNCWYNLNEGGGNVFMICGTNITGISSVEDLNTWTVFVNNTDGVITSSTVTFRITLPYEYDDLTKKIIQILQALIIFALIWIVFMCVRWVYEGEMTLGRLIIVIIQVSLGFIGLLFLGPILIKYLITIIK